jgi:asparagine synthase (glutamine-hydrolysing)
MDGSEVPASLRRMAARLGDPTSTSESICTETNVAVAVHGPDARQFLVESEQMVGVFSGSPYWADRDLARISADFGMGSSLVTAYRRHGIDFLNLLRGPFSLGLIDRVAHKAIVATDRMGICELYFSFSADSGLAFSSSTRSLAAFATNETSIRYQAIFEYMYFHMVPSPGSIFSGQSKLAQGEYAVLSDGDLKVSRYWRPDFENIGDSSERELATELEERLRQAVDRCLTSADVGCFLSGGIDSSTITGLVSAIDPPAKTFTIGFREQGYDETEFARTTVGHFGANALEYFITPQDVVDILPRIAEAYDQPFGNSSVVPTYYCAKLARENGIQLLLAGDGGDEIFGGNARYVTQQVFGVYGRFPDWLRTKLIEPICHGVPGGDHILPVRKLKRYIAQANVPMPDRLQTYNYFSRTPVDDILHLEFLDSIDADGPIDLQRNTYRSSTATSMLNRMLEFDWQYTLADNDLRKVNRMCQIAGVEVRYPFLDDELVEFSTRVPAALKIRHFRLRYFIKRALRDFLPTKVLRKSKQGFGLPFGVWMTSYKPLQELAYDSLADFGRRRIVQAGYLEQLVHRHRSEHAHYYGEFIWVLMMLELWLRSHEA